MGRSQPVEESRIQWQENRRWLADIEDASELFGYDWQPHGIEPNRKMIQTLCDEELAQGLILAPLEATTVFAEFEQVMKEQ